MSCPIAVPFASVKNVGLTSVISQIKKSGYMSFRPNTYMRLGRLGLEHLARSQMSHRDWAILSAINECRLLSSQQIQKLYFPDYLYSSNQIAQRICRRTLYRLNKNGVINRSNRQIGGIQGGSTSFVYGLGAIGARLTGKNPNTHYIDRISTLFLEHTVAINEIYTNLKVMTNSGQINIMNIQTEPNSWRQFMTGYGAVNILKPDLYVRLRDINNTVEYLWFIELDRGTSHPVSIIRQAEMYRTYYLSGSEKKVSRVFPRVLWVAPDKTRQTQLISALKQANQKIPGMHLVTITDDAIEVLTDVHSK